jgi:uncharacterized membrane protein YhaH (DUF805 family)
MDFSGWWVLLEFVPYVNVLMFLFLGFVSGTPGPNRFGPGRASFISEAAV